MLSEKTILIVEDAALIAVDIETVLGELGAARILTEGGGGRRDLSTSQLDLAIVDIRTAVGLGGSLLEDLDRDGVPVVFLSTDPEVDSVPEFSGRFATVPKPFTYKQICAAIADCFA